MEEERNRIIRIINGRLETHDNSKEEAQSKLHEICDGLRKQIDDLENSINNEMEEAFNAEDSRLQTIFNNLSEKEPTDDNEISKEIQRAKTELLVAQLYDVVENDNNLGERLNFSNMYKLKIERRLASLKLIDFEERKPTNLTATLTEEGKNVSVSFTFFSNDEIKILKPFNLPLKVEFKIWLKNDQDESIAKIITKDYIIRNKQQQVIIGDSLSPNVPYLMKMRIKKLKLYTQWSDEITEFTITKSTLSISESSSEAASKFKTCVWKECPIILSPYKSYYFVDKSKRIVSKSGGGYCTVIGNQNIPPNQITSWNIKMINEGNNGDCFWVGVAPFDIDQCYYYKFERKGWYLDCYSSSLFSGAPQMREYYHYGPNKKCGEYVKKGDSVGVVMDMIKGELSFVLDGVNHGVAYKGIPLDKPLVPCVIFRYKYDSFELII